MMTGSKINTQHLIGFLANNFLSFRSCKLEQFLEISFLCDWKNTLDYKVRLIQTGWSINDGILQNTGYEKLLLASKYISINENKTVMSGEDSCHIDSFSENSIQFMTCSHVIKIVSKLSENRISKITRSTYPFLFEGNLNLHEIVEEYKPIRTIISDNSSALA